MGSLDQSRFSTESGDVAGGRDLRDQPAVGWTPKDPIGAILEVIRRGERFLVCSHSRPDGDAVGSMLAMGGLLRQMGKRADLVAADRVPHVYRRLPGVDGIRFTMRVQGRYDAVILLECDSVARTKLRGLDRLYQVNIDHHPTGTPFAHLNWIDHEAASVGELVHRIVTAAGATVTPEMAAALYTTILTDTGGFCYGGTRASTFALARELVEAGADPIRIAQDIYFSTATSKLLLLGAALSNLKREGRIAWLWVTHQDMVRSCAAEEDCEGIVNYAVSIADVEVALFFARAAGGRGTGEHAQQGTAKRGHHRGGSGGRRPRNGLGPDAGCAAGERGCEDSAGAAHGVAAESHWRVGAGRCIW